MRPAIRRRLEAAGLALLLLAGCGAVSAPVATATNVSRPTACAEEDNVDVRLSGEGIRSFSISAQHPRYLASLARDSTDPDFRHCDMSGDPSFAGKPRSVILYRDAAWELDGYSFSGFWRAAETPVRVGPRREEGLHLLQLFRTVDGRRIEFLVLYPADGYWRARPLPPAGWIETGYGSSFLVGPIEAGQRPFVRLSDVEFRPEHQDFLLRFTRGGTARLRIAAADERETRLEIALDDVTGGFAALRSMFVAADNNDTAEIDLVRPDGTTAMPQSVMSPLAGSVTRIRFARRVVSRHNSSAPDMIFGDFGR